MPSRSDSGQSMQGISPNKKSSGGESSSDREDQPGEEENIQLKIPINTKKVFQNPFFRKEDSSDVSSDTESEFDSGSESESGEEEDQETVEPKGPEDGEDPLITALKAAKERKHVKDRNSPPDLKFSNEVMDISFHPENNLLGVSLIDGQIDIFACTNEVNTLKKRLKIHKFSVRTLEFDVSGTRIFSGSGGTGDSGTIKITDVETSQVAFKAVNCHSSPLYKIKPMTEHLFASGDEDGMVKLWDSRQKPNSGHGSYGQVMEAKPFEEFVSDIYFDANLDEGRRMVVSSGEGTLQSFNVRGKRPDMQSEQYEGELTSMACVHRNSKLVAGCGDGKLYMFNWGEFGYHSADFPGHPDAINAIVAVTDNVIVTACEDGAIRAVHLYPHRFLGTVGHHHGDSGRPVDFPIEKLDVSGSGDIIASTSHDQRVKFWNIAYLEKMEYQKTKKPYLQPKKMSKKTKTRRKDAKMLQAREIEHQLPSSKRGNRKEFFKGMDE